MKTVKLKLSKRQLLAIFVAILMMLSIIPVFLMGI
ncbi:conserved hypothetical protein [Methanocaldococcus vulcanius M7]|uniref:Uncharacterized protein n=1 Tax=Methanocaldococcus vulcanius (strain ATCC 700851 / DSM 12094 / M7) TaxID=579137 RepID=C9RDP8_METVM|nr:conserved hypothetical protein [Methanocaldococcus vulcanius M7]